MELLNWDASELSEALAARKISAVELMQATLDRIVAVNGKVNAVVSLRNRDALLAEAEAADAGPRKGWLHGIPMAIKDLADAEGLPTSQGSPLFGAAPATRDHPAVARLRAAGAIVIGKTNTPEFGLGSHTFNPVHGATCNPYDLDRSAGGSSGGAAAALAARMVAVADGSDMMGSLRNPVGWNNVYGMRPSWGTVPSGNDGALGAGLALCCRTGAPDRDRRPSDGHLSPLDAGGGPGQPDRPAGGQHPRRFRRARSALGAATDRQTRQRRASAPTGPRLA